MNVLKSHFATAAIGLLLIASCSDQQIEQKNQTNTEVFADILITDGLVYTGESTQGQSLDIAVCGQVICGLYPNSSQSVQAIKVIDASGKIVSPGFIDPHTHSIAELLSKDKNHNLNYLTQGVTTVVNGNDGGGPSR